MNNSNMATFCVDEKKNQVDGITHHRFREKGVWLYDFHIQTFVILANEFYGEKAIIVVRMMGMASDGELNMAGQPLIRLEHG